MASQTFSEFEELGLRKNPYKGLDFFDLTAPVKARVPVTFALSPNEKASMSGFLSFDRHENSYAFNDEVVISCWSREPPIIEKRAENQGYYRLEVPVPLDTFERMLELALRRIRNFRRTERGPVAQKVGDFL
jgi:hypothetical protein